MGWRRAAGGIGLGLLVAVAQAGCYQAHERDPAAALVDAGIVARDAPRVERDASPLRDVSIVLPADAFATTETLYTITTGQCFTLATHTVSEGAGMRCGDFNLEGAFVPYLVGIDGTLCELPGNYTSLASIPTTSSGGCGRVVNLQVGDGTNLAFIVRLAGHVYRVHVWSSTPPTMTFSFDRVT